MKYRSKLEQEVHKKLGMDWAYEELSVPYVIERNYLSDFSNDKYVLEIKGYFRSGDQRKYLSVAESLKEREMELVFVFQRPSTKVRKGARMTMAEWADRHGIRWYSADDIKKLKKELK